MSGIRTWLFLLLLTPALVSGQVIYISKAKIRFERKVNYARVFDQTELTEVLRKESSEGLVTYFEYSFEGARSLYRSEYTETGDKRPLLEIIPAVNNAVYRDCDSGLETAEKKVYDKTYLIRDSLTDFKWNITEEKRNIAGFECRKAVGMLLDSIPVIAFYSEEFLNSGGPESFTGLPGMILGVAVPRLHVTWYALKVEMSGAGDNLNITSPATGEYLNRGSYLRTVRRDFREDQLLINRFLGWILL